MAEPSPRDRKAALRVLQVAQVAYDLSRFPKKQVLGDAADTKRLRDSIAATRAASADLSPALRDGTALKWPELIADAGDPEAAWRIAKRVIPTLFAELRPLVGDDPEAAFLPVVEAKDQDEAIAIAKTWPAGGLVEVRPVDEDR